MIPPEIEFRAVAMQVLFRHLMIGSHKTTLEQAEVALSGVDVDWQATLGNSLVFICAIMAGFKPDLQTCRAEQRGGELLAGMERQKPHRPENRSHDGTSLFDIDLTKSQSSRW